MKRIITALTATLIGITALAGCGQAGTADDPLTDKSAIVQLPDGRQVTCVYAGSDRGGVTCDWAHVSGADKDDLE